MHRGSPPGHRRADGRTARRARPRAHAHDGETAQGGAPTPAAHARAQGDQGVLGSVCHRPRRGEESPLRRRPQPLPPFGGGGEEGDGRFLRGRGDREVEHPPRRAHGVRQDASRPDARKDARRAVRHRRRDRPHAGRLRRRGCREPCPLPFAERERRCGARQARHHLHRRDRQDRLEDRQCLDHPRRERRGCSAGAPEDHRGDRLPHSAEGRAQAPRPGIHRGRHDEHPLHLRRRVRRPRQDRRRAKGRARHRLRLVREGRGGEKGRPQPAGRPPGGSRQVRPHPGVHGSFAHRHDDERPLRGRPRARPHRAEELRRPPVSETSRDGRRGALLRAGGAQIARQGGARAKDGRARTPRRDGAADDGHHV